MFRRLTLLYENVTISQEMAEVILIRVQKAQSYRRSRFWNVVEIPYDVADRILYISGIFCDSIFPVSLLKIH